MKTIFQLLLLACIAMHTITAFAVCSPVPGADQLWSNPSLHWVLIGELHGSNETPLVFENLVCDALARGKQVTVALERPSSEQSSLDDILTAQNLSSAKEHLLKLPGWQEGMDGRASEAMLRLLISLRTLRKEYPALRVFAFEATYAGAAVGARDEAMGRALLALHARQPNRLILVLTGNVHAMQRAMFGYDFAAMYLPQKEVVTLEATDRGGESWSNSGGACGASEGGVPDKSFSRPYGIYFDPSLAPFGTVNGVLALGRPLTASPPAAGEPTPLPACREKFLLQQHALNKAK